MDAPIVVLDRPQLGENIGFVARAMMNCGLRRLRLVRPRDGWPNPAASAAAAGADAVIEGVEVFDTIEGAVADIHRLYATTARRRGLSTPVLDGEGAAREMRAEAAEGCRLAVLFGREASGLDNDAVALADAIVEFRLDPAFRSLNLAQAVLLVGYGWWCAGPADGRDLRRRGDLPPEDTSPPATKEEMANFFSRLERALAESGFLRHPEKRPRMVRNLRALFTRARPSTAELGALHGIVESLRRGRPGDPPDAA